ncbi:GntR family transcriptional regulator [Mangrovitalea sediminis]|uniref:GntR family transcriptional regulator n=1 Tax=Mangrovitalea sediminis TaxID=1982043 RepID=UPI000BE4D078|nr:GntR family transcriptional regulator [Mangrovitalea sediminis]
MEFKAPDTLAEQLANYLGQRIIMGELPAGERLHELSIANQLEVSRGSVREALYILQRRHLITILPRKGAEVMPLTAHSVKSLYRVYAHLLELLADELVGCWQEKDKVALLERVSQVKRLIESNPRDVPRIVEASFDVMEICCTVVGNPFLQEALENFKPAISRTYYLSMERFRSEIESTRDFFDTLTIAVLARDRQAARKAVQRFGEHQCEMILTSVETQEEGSRQRA